MRSRHYYQALALMQPFSAKSIRRNKFLLGTHLLHTPGSRETIVDKMPCLGAYAPSGIRTHDPLITSREHEPQCSHNRGCQCEVTSAISVTWWWMIHCDKIIALHNSIPIPHIKAVPEPPWCAELECYCCNQMACAAKLRKNITEDRP